MKTHVRRSLVFLAVLGVTMLTASVVSAEYLVETLAEYEFPSLPEGIALDQDGNVYVGMPLTGEIRKRTPDGTETPLATTPAGLLGLAADEAGNTYAALVSSFPPPDTPPNPDTHGVWQIQPDGTAERFAPLPLETGPNYVVIGEGGNLFVSDSYLGKVYRILPDRTVEDWVFDPLLLGDPGAPMPPGPIGANGLTFSGSDLLVNNTTVGTIVRIPVQPDGSAGAPMLAFSDARLFGADGLVADDQGNLYVANIAQNTILRIAPEGTIDILADVDDGLDGPSSLAMGMDQEIFFVNSGLFTWAAGGDPSPSLMRVVIPEPSNILLLLTGLIVPLAWALRRRKQAARCLALVSCAVFLGVGTVEAGTIVVPPALENVEGNRFYGGVPQPTGFRVQHVYPASDFAQMAPSPSGLVQLVFRPDHSITAPRTAVWHDFELRLSTTNRGLGSLSSVFNNNFGDDMTIVASGDLTTSTRGVGPPAGPRPFDYVVDFEQPFVYDPSDGNLLVDVRCSSLEGLPYFDAEDYGDGLTRTLFAASGSASVATFTGNGVSVLAFSVVPEPLPGDLSGDGLLDAADIDLLNAEVRAGGNDVAIDLNGDKLVNAEDQRVWVEELADTYFGDANLDRMVDAVDLNQLGLNWRRADAISWIEGDFNGDGHIDSEDLNSIGLNWQRGVDAATARAPVPEPSSLAFAFAVSLVFILSR